MLLTPTRFRRAALIWAAATAQLWPALVLAQAQVEAVPEPPPAFDMWNLEAFDDPAIALPGEPDAPAPPLGIGLSDPDGPPPPGASNTNDSCRHFTAEERRLLPTLCGATD